MNKGLFNYSQRLLKRFRFAGKEKIRSQKSQILQLHNRYNFGTIVGDELHFTAEQRADLIRRVQELDNIDLFAARYPEQQSRQQRAVSQRNEKQGSYAVSRDFILLNALVPLQLNNQQIPVSPFTSLGIYLKAEEILSIEHQQIVLVENLEIMANLSALNLPHELQQALWLYRGDIKKQQKTSRAYQFFRRFKGSHQLICFSDLDPKGIEIALTSDAHYWLTAEDDNVLQMTLSGVENEWFKQTEASKYLQEISDLPEKCQTTFTQMRSSRKTLKQEHLLAHNIKLGLYSL